MTHDFSPAQRGEPFRVPCPPLFELGRVVATPGAMLTCNPEYLFRCLMRHVRGDWGDASRDDHIRNAAALFDGDRLLSAYPIDPAKPCEGFGDNCLWIITEADRSVTTFLLPAEY